MASADSEASRRPRPLSPHLSIYRPIVTMVMSIMHRATGIINVGGLLLVVGYLLAIASGPEAYGTAAALYSSWFGRVVLVAFTWSLIHHLVSGIRYFLWDFGLAFGPERYAMSWAALVAGIVLTIALWVGVVAMEIV
ncbi:succinate dehydrogenase, cytochrome b556 subunit [Acuticoccus sp.]|uniref:succinate dehydrogenase, cytochrome b556 subunit n=1 Tax=Acuticoccus sp. TaxID=1904378 RepID=UPI003B52EEEF